MRPPKSPVWDRLINRSAQKWAEAGHPHLKKFLLAIGHNTLLRAVIRYPSDPSSTQETEIITGDIPAMWFRDSVLQTMPWWKISSQCSLLTSILNGLARRLARGLCESPYANALRVQLPQKTKTHLFSLGIPLSWMDPQAPSPHASDVLPSSISRTNAWELKWELDSVAFFLLLISHCLRTQAPQSHHPALLWQQIRPGLVAAVSLLQIEQQHNTLSSYDFLRSSAPAIDTLYPPIHRLPARLPGLIWSAFRPSDDRALLPFSIPANALLFEALRQILSSLPASLHQEDPELIQHFSSLHHQIGQALEQLSQRILTQPLHPLPSHPACPPPSPKLLPGVLPYEWDGADNGVYLDDPNIPGFLSLRWIAPSLWHLPAFWRCLSTTEAFVLSPHNPNCIQPTLPTGETLPPALASEHTPPQMVWPLSYACLALNHPLNSLPALQALAYLSPDFQVHEAVDPHQPARFTRPWFDLGQAISTLALVQNPRNSG